MPAKYADYVLTPRQAAMYNDDNDWAWRLALREARAAAAALVRSTGHSVEIVHPAGFVIEILG